MTFPTLRKSALLLSMATVLTLAGCGRFSDSGWNPLGWFAQEDTGPTTLAPKGGYPDASDDFRSLVPAATNARFEPLVEGRLLVVEGAVPTKGWNSAALVTETPQPGDRLTPDADGVLRLRFLAVPPVPGSPQAAMPANPQTDKLTVGLTLSHEALADIRQIVVMSASNTLTLKPR
ncbi:hypothetical protein [Paracoccus pacificus]|uniref:Lipoprotein n=1 Tax=Paracoccus pacificus TaxID=1463598 RepID=A0ABW4RBD1_9RHOB